MLFKAHVFSILCSLALAGCTASEPVAHYITAHQAFSRGAEREGPRVVPSDSMIAMNRQSNLLAEIAKDRDDVESRSAAAQVALVKLANVKEGVRGLVVTLASSSLFAANKSTLLPLAQRRIDQVALALAITKEYSLIVENHPDPQGSIPRGLELSQERASIVRSLIIAQGYSGRLIEAHGVEPLRMAGGRSGSAAKSDRNGRIEIIVIRPAIHSRFGVR